MVIFFSFHLFKVVEREWNFLSTNELNLGKKMKNPMRRKH